MNDLHSLIQLMKQIQIELRQIIGDDFFQTEIDGYSPDAKTLSESFRKEYKAHPLALMFHSCSGDIQRSAELGMLSFGEASKECMNLWIYLNSIKGIQNFSRIIDKIKQKDHYYSTLFEARIISEYLNKGYDLSIQDESPGNGKTNDFIIKTNNYKINIECKSLLNVSLKEKAFCDELYSRIFKILQRDNSQYNIEIYCKKELSGGDVDEIVSAIKKTKYSFDDIFLSNEMIIIRKVIISNETNQMIKKILCNDNMSHEYITTHNNEVELAKFSRDMMNLSDGSAQQGGSILLTNLIAGEEINTWTLTAFRVGIYQHYNFDISERIISAIKDASRQIPQDEIGIVHVEIPQDISKYFLIIIDKCYEQIQHFISKSHKRINSVVLSTYNFENNSHSVGLNIYYSINNLCPNICINNEFPSLEIIAVQNEFPDDEGTFAMEYYFDKSWNPLSIQLLTSFSSIDGTKKFNIYLIDKSSIRIEIINDYFGRIVVTPSQHIEIPLETKLLFVVSWKDKQLSFRIFDNKKNKIIEINEPYG